MTRIIVFTLVFASAVLAIDKAPRLGVLGSRYNYPTRGLIGAYPANEGTGTTLVDYSASLGYRNGGSITGRCGDLSIVNSNGTIPFAWNPAPYSIASRPLRTGNALNDVGFHLGGTFNPTRTPTDPQNDHIPMPSCSTQVRTAIFIIKGLSDSGSGTTEIGGGYEHPLLGGDQNDDPIGFYASMFSAPVAKNSLWGVTSGSLEFSTYWNDHGTGTKYIHCQGDDKVIVLTVNNGLRLYCDGVEVPYSNGLSNISRLWPGTTNYIGRDDSTISPNFNFNQPLNKTIQWMSFHSVALSPQEILQATYALKYQQRKYARQKPNLIVVVGDSVNDECYATVGNAAGQCPAYKSPNGTTIAAAMTPTQTDISFPGGSSVISYDAGLGTGGFVRIDSNEIVRITSCTTALAATSCTVQRGCSAGQCSGTGTAHNAGAYVQTAWPIQLRAMLSSSAYYVNGAISYFDDTVMRSAGTEQNYRLYEGSGVLAQFDLAASGIYNRRILIGGECINAVGGNRTPTQIEATHTQWAQEHESAGWEVLMTTCTPMGGSLPAASGGTPPDGKNAARTAVNSWLRSNWNQAVVNIGGTSYTGPNAVGFIDTDTDEALNADHCEAIAGNPSNLPPCAANSSPTVPYLDSVSHLTSVGSYRFALRVKAALNARGID